MNTLFLLQQMLILFAMMMVGYLACKAGWADRLTGQKLTSLIVHILNPVLIFSSLCGKSIEGSGNILAQNFLVVLLYFLFVILCGFAYSKIRRLPDTEAGKIRMLTTFSNIGFMGIPIVRSVYGSEYVILLVFYILVFNVLVYTYGLYLCTKMSGEHLEFSPKKIINIGTVTCVVSILFFLLQIPVPAPVLSFFSDLGNTVIPLSMIVIGISMAQIGIKEMLFSREAYLFILFKMLLVPAAGILLFRLLPLNAYVYRVFTLVVSMPCAAIAGMMAEEYAGRGDECNRAILLSTIVSVITIPLLSLL